MQELTNPPWDALTRVLAFLAITPGLRSVLLPDTLPETLRTVGARLKQMVEVATGREIHPVIIGSTESDDILFGDLALLPKPDALRGFLLGWRPGLLTQGDLDKSSRLVLVPDLSRLSLAAARACVVLIDASEGHVERHGTSKRWTPDIYWLASCASPDLARIFRHLLDRFPLRVRAPALATQRGALDLLERIKNDRSGADF